MPHVITQPCCNDASCVPVCPVGAIHPHPGEPGFKTTEMLYIDPATCVDCGVCVSACPVGAILPDNQLSGTDERYRDFNSSYYQQNPIRQNLDPVAIAPPHAPVGKGTLRVAIVGSGPAGSYAAAELLEYPNVEVAMFDRLPTPWGLVRAGVAPDHPGTKAVIQSFERTAANGRFRFYLNVEIGTHISHDELLEHHHAVIYAYGAAGDRQLGIPGEDLPGSVAASEFVKWYNGHPDYAERTFDFSGTRAVVIGNGNVALDIARILVTDADTLAATDMADHAVNALRNSNITEVVVVGRRGPAQAGYTTPELLALGDLPQIDTLADRAETELDDVSRSQLDDPGTPTSVRHKTQIAAEYARREATPGHRRIVLRYLASPVEILGEDRVTALRLVRNRLERKDSGEIAARATTFEELVETGLVIRSVGFRGRPITGVPFDSGQSTVPNIDGRVVNAPGVYTTGWIKRGPSGVIGTNKKCAQDTVATLVEDGRAGRLHEPTGSAAEMSDLIAQRQPARVDASGWRTIDSRERERGHKQGKQRSKITRTDDLLAAATDCIPLDVDED
ncbi:FAD-dependent oxidoreductase [Nocardia sp. NPDC005825]|uniref:FAD-dependent oxidoreductase n=1 Tax=unclassified Nocardia TaxID=2637762 RepID=UPI0033DC020A